MKFSARSPQALPCAVLCFLFAAVGLLAQSAPGSFKTPVEAKRKALEKRFALLPLRFEPNRGQSSSDAKFLAQGNGFAATFREHETDFFFSGRTKSHPPLRLKFVKAGDALIAGEDVLPGTVNYFSGRDAEKWHTALPTFGRLRYTQIYPGTDLVYYGNSDKLEFDFQLSPGADPNDIQMHFEGAESVEVDREGDLIVTAEDKHAIFQRPVIYQPSKDGGRDIVAGSFEVSKKNTVRFAIADYDRTRALIIDPIFNYSTYVGGFAEGVSVAVNQNGEAYVTGFASMDFPTTAGSYDQTAFPQSSFIYPGDPFIAKFSSDGKTLLYSTFLCGKGDDRTTGIVVDAHGNAFVAGTTSSKDFPITPGALQTTYNASKTTGFVTELNSTGTALIYSTYLGGSTSAGVTGIVIDDMQNAYLTGTTQDKDFPVTPGAYRTAALTKASDGLDSGFIAKLNPTGTALIYSTYLGGSQWDSPTAIAVDSTGQAYVGGNTVSNDFPVSAGVIGGSRKAANRQSGFITKLNASGSALVYSTYLGGSGLDTLSGIAVDPSGNAYVTGSTTSADFPVTAGAFQSSIGMAGTSHPYLYPQVNAFVSELNSTGTSLTYSTFLGGGISDGIYADQGDEAKGIAIDAQGMVYVTGEACTGDFPVTEGAFETENMAGYFGYECTAFLTKMNPIPNTPLLYSTFLGGTGNGDPYSFDAEISNSVAVDPVGNVYLTGLTRSVDFPVTAGTVNTPFTGVSIGAFVTALNGSEMRSLPVPTVVVSSDKDSVVFGQPVTFTITVRPASEHDAPTGSVALSLYKQEPADNLGEGIGFNAWTNLPLDATGKATFTTSSLQLYDTYVNAFYLGDAENAPGWGMMTQKLTYIPTTTTITASANNVPYGTPVVFTVTVLDDSGKPAKGEVALGSLPALDSNGQVTWTNGQNGSPLPIGANTITIKFLPALGYQSSTGTLIETFTPLGKTPDPTFSPGGGTYDSGQYVVLNDANSAATIYYTTDGSTPGPGLSSSFLTGYGFNIPVFGNQTIKAMAVAPGYTPSNVVSTTYTFVPDFSLAVESMMILHAGKSDSTPVDVRGVYAFSGTVSLSCSGLPAGSTCSFAPATVSGSGSSTLTITTAATAGMSPGPKPWHLFPVTAWATVLGCVCMRRRRISSLIVIAFALCFSMLNGCGGAAGSNHPSTPGPTANTYTVKIMGTSGSLSHSTSLTLEVLN